MLEPDIVEEARIGMHARILRCPLGGNPQDCPLHEIRLRPVEDRIAWLNGLSDAEVVATFDRHKDCLENKLENGQLADGYYLG